MCLDTCEYIMKMHIVQLVGCFSTLCAHLWSVTHTVCKSYSPFLVAAHLLLILWPLAKGLPLVTWLADLPVVFSVTTYWWSISDYGHMVLVTRNFTKSADCPCRKSAVFPRHRRGYSRNHARVSAESCKGVRGIVQGCPSNRERVSVESWKGVRGIVKGCPRNCVTSFIDWYNSYCRCLRIAVKGIWR